MGYVDMATLSFAGIEPTIALVGAASKLSIYRLHKIANYLPTDLPANWTLRAEVAAKLGDKVAGTQAKPGSPR